MAEILTDGEFKEAFADAGYARNADILWALGAAKDEAIDLIGQEFISTAETPGESPTAEVIRRNRRIKRAIGYLAFAELAPRIGSRLREAGIVENESNIMGDNAVKYLDPEKVRLIVADNRALAMKELGAYMPTNEPEFFADTEMQYSSVQPTAVNW